MTSGLHLILLGLALVVTAWALRRSWTRSSVSSRRDVLSEVRNEMRETERRASKLHQIELRLHEYSRQVEGRVRTTLETLDQLVAEAEWEIDRLQNLLGDRGGETGGLEKMERGVASGEWEVGETRRGGEGVSGSNRPPTTDHEPRTRDDEQHTTGLPPVSRHPHDPSLIIALSESGFHEEEIADGMGLAVEEIRRILHGRGRADAA